VEEKKENWFSQAEGRLYAYPALIAKHRTAIAEYRLATPSPKARNYTATSFIRGGTIDGEAERWVLSREKIVQGVLFLEQRVQDEMAAITSLWEILTDKEKKLVTMKYFEQRPITIILRTMGYSYRNCHRVKKQAVTKAAYIYGFLDYDTFIGLCKVV
jgi:hypothetical protein